jgi:hypothetical protein
MHTSRKAISSVVPANKRGGVAARGAGRKARRCVHISVIARSVSDEAISCRGGILDCFAPLAMTTMRSPTSASASQRLYLNVKEPGHTRVVSPRVSAPEPLKASPSKWRGRREGRMLRLQTKSRRRHHRYEPNIRPSLRNGFNGVLRALPGEPDVVVTVTSRHPAQLSASLGAPGPHDFAVRCAGIRP